MTYFETPQDALAHACGLTVQQLESIQDAISADEEALYNMGQPHLDPEDRDLIAYRDVKDPEETHIRMFTDGADLVLRVIPGASD